MTQHDVSSGPLAGVHVADFGHYIAGPFSAHLFGELGATVIKVQPLRGDAMKGLVNPYAAVNRGKLSLAIDLKAAGAGDVLRRLVAWSDIVSHNYRPGVAERLGFGRDQIHAIDPSVVVLESLAYGFDGPSSSRPGLDPVFWGFGGHAWRGGGSAGPPVCNSRLGQFDTGTGSLGAFGAACALYRSRRTGDGGSVSVSLMDTSLYLAGDVVIGPDGSPSGDMTVDRDRTGTHPAEALYELDGGWVAVVARTERARRDLARAIGLPALAGRPSTEWNADDQAAIRAALRGMTNQQLEKAVAGTDVVVVACATDAKERIMASESLKEAGLVVRSGDSPGDAYIGFPVTFERTPLRPAERMHCPETGEHTDSVLRILGFSDEEIANLHDTNVVATDSRP